MEPMDDIYRRHAATVYKYLLSLCHDPHTAEELTQETFYQAVRSIGRFDGSCQVSTWLCQIAKHLFYQHLRRQRRETPPPEEEGAPGAPQAILTSNLPEEEGALPPLPSAEEEVLDQSGRLDLLRRVHGLPEPGREVVYLRIFGNLSFREIGAVLGRTETWARVTYYRCKERLKTGGERDEK